jgi:hypothetical protein
MSAAAEAPREQLVFFVNFSREGESFAKDSAPGGVFSHSDRRRDED